MMTRAEEIGILKAAATLMAMFEEEATKRKLTAKKSTRALLARKTMCMVASKRRKIAKMSLPNVDEHQQEEGIFIPDDIMLEILVRLPARSVGRFRCVSMSWLSFTSSTSFIRSHTEHNRFSHQSVIIFRLPSSKYYLTPLNPGLTSHKLSDIDLLNESRLIGVRDGLLLSGCNETLMVRIANPLTGYSINLPSQRTYFVLDLYFHNSTSEYCLLRVWSSGTSDVLVIGQRSWRVIADKYPIELYSIDACSVDANGTLHWLSWKTGRFFSDANDVPYSEMTDIIVTFDKETEIYSLLPLPQLNNLCYDYGDLVEIKGVLGFWIVYNYSFIKVWIREECCWIDKYSINFFANLSVYPSLDSMNNRNILTYMRGEELLIIMQIRFNVDYLFRWNLKSGSCIAEKPNICGVIDMFFPYVETLLCPDHSL